MTEGEIFCTLDQIKREINKRISDMNSFLSIIILVSVLVLILGIKSPLLFQAAKHLVKY